MQLQWTNIWAGLFSFAKLAAMSIILGLAISFLTFTFFISMENLNGRMVS